MPQLEKLQREGESHVCVLQELCDTLQGKRRETVKKKNKVPAERVKVQLHQGWFES